MRVCLLSRLAYQQSLAKTGEKAWNTIITLTFLFTDIDATLLRTMYCTSLKRYTPNKMSEMSPLSNCYYIDNNNREDETTQEQNPIPYRGNGIIIVNMKPCNFKIPFPLLRKWDNNLIFSIFSDLIVPHLIL